jgi:hypothetical protein
MNETRGSQPVKTTEDLGIESPLTSNLDVVSGMDEASFFDGPNPNDSSTIKSIYLLL